jgi:UDP-N-acetylglucosamine 2-epimerase
MKVLSVVGTRPEFILLSPVDEAVRSAGFEHIVVNTGQHYDYEMSKVFFEQLHLPEPDYDLNVKSGTHGYQTGHILVKLEEVLQKERPDIVFAYGDTNSTVAAALSSVKCFIPVAHIEAGYRSFDMSMPEEINRIVADSISQLLFAFTEYSVKNLLNENKQAEQVIHVGNLKAEVLLKNIGKIDSSNILENLGINDRDYAVLTCHRQENTSFEKRFINIIRGVSESPIEIIFPVHPRTRKLIESLDIDLKNSPIRFIEPLPYIDFLRLESNAAFILTDSGGVQVEAFVLKKPCITLRYNTEHVETVESGLNELAGTDPEKIRSAIVRALKKNRLSGSFDLPALWDTEVSSRIVKSTLEKIDFARKILEIKSNLE